MAMWRMLTTGISFGRVGSLPASQYSYTVPGPIIVEKISSKIAAANVVTLSVCLENISC